MKLFTPLDWKEYELIDTGEQEKLERFGKYILCRTEPQAVWSKTMDKQEWEKLYNAKFIRKKGAELKIENGELEREALVTNERQQKGEWTLKKGMPEQWFINYNYKKLNLKLRLGLTSFGHIGVFPEQAVNWNYIYDTLQSSKFKVQSSKFKVLNLFAYTGGSSLAAKAAGADVVHVDSVRQVINWSNENAEANNLNGIRWVVEDAMKFATREARRGNKYNGIILDPPAYGRGPEGEKWLLETEINELIKLCFDLAFKDNFFLVLSLYSMGFSALIADNLISTYFKNIKDKEYGELYFPDKGGNKLPLGVFVRFRT